MDSKRSRLFYLSSVIKKQLLKEFLVFRFCSFIKSKESKDLQDLSHRGLAKFKSNVEKIYSFNPILSIPESKKERSVSPPKNIFEELKSSLKSKALRINTDKAFEKSNSRGAISSVSSPKSVNSKISTPKITTSCKSPKFSPAKPLIKKVKK